MHGAHEHGHLYYRRTREFLRYARKSGLILLAAEILLFLVIRAALTFDPSWDAIAYHYPFAARLAGICGHDCLQMTPGLEQDYVAFPVVIEFIQGWLWRLTGVPEATNFVSVAALFVFVAYLAVHWRVLWYWAVIGLTAIPVVQVYSTSSYTDLVTNVAAAIGLLTVAELLFRPDRVRVGVQTLFALSMILLGNSKTQMMPVAAAITMAFIVLMTYTSADRPDRAFDLRRPVAGAAFSTVLLLLVNATALRNLVEFGNPYYPVQISILGHQFLPGYLPPLAGNSAPEYLRGAPSPLRWLLSVFEFSAFDLRVMPYSVGQGDVPQSAPSFRMGGYFATYILTAVGFLMIALTRLGKTGLLLGGYFLALTVATALMPASHELRYYMFWALSLIALLLIIYASPSFGAELSAELSLAWRWIMLSCFVAVTMLTGGHFFRPGLYFNVADFIAKNGFEATVKKLKDGQTVCVADERFAILYSRAYHPHRAYKVIQGDDPTCDTRI